MTKDKDTKKERVLVVGTGLRSSDLLRRVLDSRETPEVVAVPELPPIYRGKSHETVGWKFKGWDGNVYLCTRWERGNGFWMRLVEVRREPEGHHKDHVLGYETCVSLRAIGGTFHKLDECYRPRSVPSAHDSRCQCSVCEGRDD